MLTPSNKAYAGQVGTGRGFEVLSTSQKNPVQ